MAHSTTQTGKKLPERVKSLFVYELHGHDQNGPLDYTNFFAAVASARPVTRRYQLAGGDQVVAIPEIRNLGVDRYALRFVLGREGDPALFYDVETGAERVERPQRNEMAALAAWLIVDAQQRVVLQERRRPGVPLDAATEALASIGDFTTRAQNPTISFHPRVGEGFLSEVDELETIKSATMVLRRPNMSWTDSANSLVAELGEESNMAQVSIDARARPKESLAKQKGFVAELKSMVTQGWGPLRSAKLVGRKAGESKDSTVTTKNYAQRVDFIVQDGMTRADETQALISTASSYLDAPS